MNDDLPHGAIIDAIDRLTVGDYACFAGGIVGSDDPRPALPAEALLAAGMRAQIEARFAAKFNHFDLRAVHSIWMKWYLNAMLPPLLLADLLLQRRLQIGLDRVGFIMSDDGRIAALRINDASDVSANDDPFSRFAPLIFDHFAPLIDMWAVRSAVTRRVYWSNVGNTFEAMLRRVAEVSGSSQRLDQARRLLAEPHWPDGRPNPLYAAVSYVNESSGPWRRRRICCLQYRLPDRRFCKACPIDDARIANMTVAM